MLALLSLLGIALAGSAIAFLGDDFSNSYDDDMPDEDGDFSSTEISDPDVGLDFSHTSLVSEPLTQASFEDTLIADDNAVYIDGRDDSDTIEGNAGDNIIFGYEGDDLIDGGDGNDTLYGDIGTDRLFGNDGDDTLFGANGNDFLSGDAGNDALSGGWGDDILTGGSGTDVITGGVGDDILDGTTGEAAPEADFLNGGDGDDLLIGSALDTLSGGSGEDEFVSDGGFLTVTDFNPGEDGLAIRYEGNPPELSVHVDDRGVTVLADGDAIAFLQGLGDFDLSCVTLIAES